MCFLDPKDFPVDYQGLLLESVQMMLDDLFHLYADLAVLLNRFFAVVILNLYRHNHQLSDLNSLCN